MKTSIWTLLSICILFLSSCIKSGPEQDNKTYIQGKLLEYGSEAPLSNVKIYLNECDGEVLGSIYCSVLDSFYTNQDGFFDYEFEHNPTGIYSGTFEQLDRYYPINDLVLNHGLNERDRFADPESWLELHLKNVDPVDWEDQLELGGPWGGGSNWDRFTGVSIDTIVSRKTRGNRISNLVWGVRKNSQVLTYSDSIYFQAHDTTHYEIFY